MSNISVIKAELEKKKIELLIANKNLEAVEKHIEGLRTKHKERELGIDGEVVQAREKAKEALLKKCSADLEAELINVEIELSELRIEKAEQMEYYSLENIKKGIIDKSPLGIKTKISIQELRQEAYDTVSPRFIDAYFSMIGKCRVSTEDFENALDNLDNAKNNFYDQRDNRLNMFLESIVDKMSYFQESGENEDEEGGSATGTIIGFGITTIALSFLLFPIYSVLCIIIYLMNFRKAFLMKESLNLLKVVEDNYKLMDKTLERRSYKEYQQKQQEIEEEYSEAMQYVQADIDDLNQQISQIKQQTIAEFTFDETEVRQSLQDTLEQIDHQIEEQLKSKTLAQAKINVISTEMASLSNQYQEAIQKAISDYINFDRVGDSKFFPKDFLLTDQEPLAFFRNARFSNFFTYIDMSMALNFIKLICLQTRTRMAPNTLYTQVWDNVNSGSGLMGLADEKAQSSLFTIVNNTSALKDEVGALTAIMQKRLTTIRTSGKDIIQYNEEMITKKSVTETYHLIIIMTPEPIMNMEELKRLMKTGYEIGIYIYVFADLRKLTDQHFSIIDNVEYCASIVNDKIVPSAQDALKQQIENAKRN